MTSLSIRLTALDAAELEEFVDLWMDSKAETYHAVERVGGANDKGRDVIGFLTAGKHEGPWHLFQCKRKTYNSSLGLPEAMGELGKVFFHFTQGAYQTLPTKYVFIAPRGVSGPVADLINHPSALGASLIDNWDKHCFRTITAKKQTPLTDEIRRAIAGYDFSSVEQMNATKIVKDPTARAALTRMLDLPLEEAPAGTVPADIEKDEFAYIDQLRRVYGEAEGAEFSCVEDVLMHAEHGQHFRDQRVRFFDAVSFKRFHRDSVEPKMLVAFQEDIYHGVIDVHRERHRTSLDRVNAVMRHASVLGATLKRSPVRPTVRQGLCHHLANEGRMKWTP